MEKQTFLNEIIDISNKKEDELIPLVFGLIKQKLKKSAANGERVLAVSQTNLHISFFDEIILNTNSCLKIKEMFREEGFKIEDRNNGFYYIKW